MKREEQQTQIAAETRDMSTDMNQQIETDEDIEVLELTMKQITGEQRAILHMKEGEGFG